MTGITNKTVNKKGICFKDSFKTFLNDLDKCSLIISNGNDLNVLKENCKFSNTKFKFCNFNFYNCRYYLAKRGGVTYKEANSSELHRIFNFNSKKKYKAHNALDDCHLILDSLILNDFFK